MRDWVGARKQTCAVGEMLLLPASREARHARRHRAVGLRADEPLRSNCMLGWPRSARPTSSEVEG